MTYRTRKIISNILLFLESILLFLILITFTLRITILNKNNVIKKLDKTNYYEKVYNETLDNMKYITRKSGYSSKIIDDTFSIEDIKRNTKNELYKRLVTQCENYEINIMDKTYETKEEYEQLFDKYDNVENYPFYKLIIENWEKETPNIEQECFYDDSHKSNDGKLKKIKSPCIDGLFYLYLREFSKKTNKDYFWFIIKFVVLFRECINQKKKDFVKEEMMSEKKRIIVKFTMQKQFQKCVMIFILNLWSQMTFMDLIKVN